MLALVIDNPIYKADAPPDLDRAHVGFNRKHVSGARSGLVVRGSLKNLKSTVTVVGIDYEKPDLSSCSHAELTSARRLCSASHPRSRVHDDRLRRQDPLVWSQL